ncbi:hypothetical protein TNCV_52091 [Trichonephila clavipes]|nr:hypothetical protein TNCV_52091 [Trichonephila clavipes]
MFANLYNNLSEYGSLRGNRHREGGPQVTRTTNMVFRFLRMASMYETKCVGYRCLLECVPGKERLFQPWVALCKSESLSCTLTLLKVCPYEFETPCIYLGRLSNNNNKSYFCLKNISFR